MTDGIATWNYAYDANGMRTSRTNGTTIYSYVYNGSQLMQMKVGNDTLQFIYNAMGEPVAMLWNGTLYYIVTTLQGDVNLILNTDNEIVVWYEYDAWGNVVQIGGLLADTLGALNPLRYRGYVYDTETGLYYLQSRYYNPEWGRFINADAFVSTGQGILGNNMFAYCENNPVNRYDPSGAFSLAYRYDLDDPFANLLSNIGFGGGGGGSVISAVATIAVMTVSAGVIGMPTTSQREKDEVLVDAAALTSSQNDAIYYGIDFYGGTRNYVTVPMTFQQADVWATAIALSQVYSDRQSWGLYTENISDAASMAVYLGAPAALTPGYAMLATSIFPDLAKGPKYYSHFHTFGRTIHGSSAPTFHIWYGAAGG